MDDPGGDSCRAAALQGSFPMRWVLFMGIVQFQHLPGPCASSDVPQASPIGRGRLSPPSSPGKVLSSFEKPPFPSVTNGSRNLAFGFSVFKTEEVKDH